MFSFFADKKNFVNIGLQKDSVVFYRLTDSTNTRAREAFIEKKPVSPMLFVAEGQTDGKGTRGRSFESKSGKGLYFSLLIPEGNKKIDSALITPIAAAAVLSALSMLLSKKDGNAPFIKWVNDIYIKNKKIAGILCERVSSGDSFGYVIGIGINLYGSDFSPEVKSIAASVEEMTGEKVNPQRLLLSVVKILIDVFNDGKAEKLIKLYRESSIKSGTEISVSVSGGAPRNARVIGLTESLALTVEYESGERESLISGDVSVKFKNV